MRKSTDHHSEPSVYRETSLSPLEDTRRKHPGESQRCNYRETCRGNVDYRIPGIPHSIVQKEDSNRKETVKRLIQQFENHPNRDSLMQDLNKLGEFNPFSEKSKELISSNTSSFARLLVRYNDLIALYTGSGHCLLHMRQVHAAYRKASTVEQGQIRRPVNSRLRYQKESYSWCQTWTICAADHVPQST